MMDLGPEKVFKSTAFEPSDEELTNYARSKRNMKKGKDIKMRSPSPVRTFEESALDDSDDDLPDPADMFKSSVKSPKKTTARRVIVDSVSSL